MTNFIATCTIFFFVDLNCDGFDSYVPYHHFDIPLESQNLVIYRDDLRNSAKYTVVRSSGKLILAKKKINIVCIKLLDKHYVICENFWNEETNLDNNSPRSVSFIWPLENSNRM